MYPEPTIDRRPRAGGAGHLLPVVALGVLMCFTPVAFVVAVGTMVAILVQRDVHWWIVTLYGLGLTAVVGLFNVRDSGAPLGHHYAGLGYGIRSMLHLDPIGVFWALLLTVPLGATVGMTVGGLLVPIVTYAA